MRIKGIMHNKDILTNTGVFAAFMAFSFFSFTLVSPIVASNAETEDASIEVGPYTMSLSASDSVPINITPTASQTVHTGSSTISYANTCPYGMIVAMSSKTENTDLIRMALDSGTKAIPSITSGTSLTDNTWGYSEDGGSTYKPIPAFSSPATILSTTSVNATTAAIELTYGVKVDNSLTSGDYSNDIIYTLSVKPQCLTYAITWNLDGGTAATGATYPAVLNFGSTIDLSTLTPTKPGYIFTGWSNGTNTFDGTETNANINPSSSPSVTMTAQWTKLMAENLEYTPPTGVTCTNAQCMIDYLSNKLN